MRMLWWVPVLLLVGQVEARQLGEITFEACTLAPKYVPASVEAFCAEVTVPENHAEPGGRQITLALALVPATGEEEPDPVFMLAGGPGQSALDSFPSVAPAFREIRRKRHVLLLDQRGTGGSKPLVCRGKDGEAAFMDELTDISPEALRGFAERCRDQLAADADLRYYRTEDAIADLDFVRARLGVDKLNLIGISYGTRVGQQFARRYPDRVRSLVLDGLAPNAQVLGAEHARNLEDALTLQFERCRGNDACRERLGDPRAALDRLSAELKANPREVAFRDAVTGAARSETLRYEHLAGLVRLYAYSPQSAALLPLVLHEAVEGRPELLMAQVNALFEQMGDMIHHGMQLSVLCNEDARRLQANPADADTVMGTEFVDFILAQCAVWPRGETPPDYHEPLTGEVPTLLLSGEFDPVTPPRYGEEVLAHLSNARHLVLNGQGHNALPVGCTPKLVARFLDTLDPEGLDADCLESLPYTPPFAGFHGWEP